MYKKLSETVEIKKIKENNNVGIFNIEGLFTGFGLTLGNAFRRALLSSLPGAAITQVKIKGVNHEFSTIPGILEDVIEITLNLKKVRFHFFAEEPQVLTLKVKKEGKVMAGDIKSTANVRVENPDWHIATITKKNTELDMELTVEKGLGYNPVESRKTERLSVGTIMIDANFSPVVRVTYLVENMRVGERTNYNRLKLEIETDGSIKPSEAFSKSAVVLKEHFEKIIPTLSLKEDVSLQKKKDVTEKKEKKKEEGKKEKKDEKKKK